MTDKTADAVVFTAIMLNFTFQIFKLKYIGNVSGRNSNTDERGIN
jgi:hypothetical protein